MKKLIRGRQQKRQVIRGSQLTSAKKIARQMKKANIQSTLSIAGCPIPSGDELQHFFIHGTTGSGKSQCIQQLLRQLREQGKRAVVYDKSGDLLRIFYRPGNDVLLNPLDARSQPWSLWAECQRNSDYESLTEALIPMPAALSVDPFWIQAARTLFANSAQALAKQPKRSTSLLLQHLFASDLAPLQKLLKGTEAESLVSDDIAKTALNIKSVLANNLRALNYVKE